ncbi:unnamed protein product, partial [Ectocarpus sp. 12 AP-2014]
SSRNSSLCRVSPRKVRCWDTEKPRLLQYNRTNTRNPCWLSACTDHPLSMQSCRRFVAKVSEFASRGGCGFRVVCTYNVLWPDTHACTRVDPLELFCWLPTRRHQHLSHALFVHSVHKQLGCYRCV